PEATPAPRQRAAAPPAAAPAPPGLDAAEAIEAIVEMHHHTKLLTPNYVTSTLGSLITARHPGQDAGDAQHVVDQLTRSGAIRVDAEPQEVEVDGARHRIRLVHLIEANPEVQRAEHAWQQRSGGAAAAAPEAASTETVE